MERILITGSTDGIGLRTAMRLAKLGKEIIVHGRDAKRCERAVKKIAEYASLNSVPKFYTADFSSLKQVARFAEKFGKEYEKLDVLINNAGVYMNDFVITQDGFETTFQVNHLSTFLLTNLLLPMLQRGESSRIIIVSSVAHTNGIIDFGKLNGEKGYEAYFAYAQSKLANVLFTYYLAKKLEGKGITVNTLHPGVISTKLLHSGFNIEGASLDEGSDTSVFLAVSPEVERVTGKYFVKMKETPSSAVSYDTQLQNALWLKSEEFTKAFL